MRPVRKPLECRHWAERDGPGFGHSLRREGHLRRNAGGQRAREEKAGEDAEARARREAERSADGKADERLIRIFSTPARLR